MMVKQLMVRRCMSISALTGNQVNPRCWVLHVVECPATIVRIGALPEVYRYRPTNPDWCQNWDLFSFKTSVKQCIHCTDQVLCPSAKTETSDTQICSGNPLSWPKYAKMRSFAFIWLQLLLNHMDRTHMHCVNPACNTEAFLSNTGQVVCATCDACILELKSTCIYIPSLSHYDPFVQ